VSAGAGAREALLFSVLKSRRVCLGLAAAGALHVVLLVWNLPGWPCPLHQVTGLPCPGCGLGRAAVLCLRGEWARGLEVHAFAPVALGFLLLVAISAILPAGWRAPWLAVVRSFEERAPVAPLVLGALLFYWMLRFALDGSRFHWLRT